MERRVIYSIEYKFGPRWLAATSLSANESDYAFASSKLQHQRRRNPADTFRLRRSVIYTETIDV